MLAPLARKQAVVAAGSPEGAGAAAGRCGPDPASDDQPHRQRHRRRCPRADTLDASQLSRTRGGRRPARRCRGSRASPVASEDSTGMGIAVRQSRASSSRSSPPRTSARAPGSGCPSPTASCASTAAGSTSRARRVRGAAFTIYLPEDGGRHERSRPGRRRRPRTCARCSNATCRRAASTSTSRHAAAAALDALQSSGLRRRRHRPPDARDGRASSCASGSWPSDPTSR